VGLERGPLSLVRTTEELLRRNPRLTTGGIRCADHATPSISKSWHYFAYKRRSLGRHSSLADQSRGVFSPKDMQKENNTEEFYLLGYNAVRSVESQPTFRRNMLPPSSWSKYKPSKKLAWKQMASRAIGLPWFRIIQEAGGGGEWKTTIKCPLARI
jgi:hypothetical protein